MFSDILESALFSQVLVNFTEMIMQMQRLWSAILIVELMMKSNIHQPSNFYSTTEFSPTYSQEETYNSRGRQRQTSRKQRKRCWWRQRSQMAVCCNFVVVTKDIFTTKNGKVCSTKRLNSRVLNPARNICRMGNVGNDNGACR